MDEAPPEPLVAALLPRVLERMGQLGAQLQVELARLEQSPRAPAERLEPLRLELDELGWLLSVLSAAGEGRPDLARHHARGLAILLGFAFGAKVLGTGSIPALEAAAGPPLAWFLTAWLHAHQPRWIRIEQTPHGRWLVQSEAAADGTPALLSTATSAWFAAERLEPRAEGERRALTLPADWLHEDEDEGAPRTVD